jgi:hypothetical protein
MIRINEAVSLSEELGTSLHVFLPIRNHRELIAHGKLGFQPIAKRCLVWSQSCLIVWICKRPDERLHIREDERRDGITVDESGVFSKGRASSFLLRLCVEVLARESQPPLFTFDNSTLALYDQ